MADDKTITTTEARAERVIKELNQWITDSRHPYTKNLITYPVDIVSRALMEERQEALNGYATHHRPHSNLRQGGGGGMKAATTPKKLSKIIKPLKSEEWETDRFECEVSGNMIFIWGGGMEGCVSKRVMKEFIKWMREKKVL